MHPDNKRNGTLTDVWKEAATHYRHLENQRNQYLVFYFTFLPASIALTSTAIKDTSIKEYFGYCIELILLLNLSIGLLIFIAIKKIGFALNMHKKVINNALDLILAEIKLSYDKLAHPFNRENPTYDSKILSNQGSILKLLIVISIALDTIYLSIMVYLPLEKLWIKYLILSIPISLLIFYQIKIFRIKIKP